MRSEVDDAKWFEDKKKPSVETEISFVNGRTRKKFIYNNEKFPNVRKQHGAECDCDYCNPRCPLPSAPPITTEKDLYMYIDRTWNLKPKTNELGEEIDYVELKEPTETEIEDARENCATTKTVGKKQCAPPFGADAIPMGDSIICWANAQLDMAYQEELAEQQRLEELIGVESTVEYQEKSNLKGLIVCYVYCDGAWSSNIELDRQKEEWDPILTGLMDDYETVYLPVQDGHSRIEIVNF